MLDMQRCKHSGTDTNASPQPNLGTHKRVSAKHAGKQDTHNRVAHRPARDQQKTRLLSRKYYCRVHSAVYNLPPEREIIPVRQ